MRSRQFGVEHARAQEDLAASRLLPQVSGSLNFSHSDYQETGLAARRNDGVRHILQARKALLDLSSYFML